LEGGFRVANDLDLQAVMLIPVGALSVDEAHRMTDRVFFKLKDDMGENEPPLNTSVGEQGGFVPRFGSWDARRDDGWEKVTLRSLDIVAEAIEASGFKLGKDLGIGLDCAMNTQRFDPNTQTYTLEKYAKKIQKDAGAVPDPTVTTERLLALYQGIAESHAVYYIEDGFHNADEQGWLKLTKSIGHKARVVGDDLFSDKSGALSPRHLLRRNADAGRANGILVMPNRAGTVSATIDLAQFAKELGYTPAMSVRARETEDDSIVDMAVAAEVPLLRCGGLQCSERNSKFDRLKRIEALVNPTARYASASVLPPMQGA
jgi:enolase